MSDVFSYIWGQPKVRDFLRESANKCSLSQSYLFSGPAGSGKTQAAFVLAAAALCERAGCNECETCKRVMRRTHPDVHYFEPEGAHAYLVEQVRDIIADVQLAPISARGSVYIINRADLMNAASANAFLKTLEEPPAHATIILIARTKDSVLPTLVSRCVCIPFTTLTTRESAGLVEQNAKVTPERARQALAACSGSVEAAIDFAKDNNNFERMNKVFKCMVALKVADDWDIIKMSRNLTESSKGALDSLIAEQKAYEEENKDYLNASTKKKLQDKNKRAQSRAKTAAYVQNLDIMRSWLRDVMMLCVCGDAQDAPTAQPPQITNTNVILDLKDAAAHTTAPRVARALRLIDKMAEKLHYNVSPQTCTDALLIEFKEVLYDANSSSDLVV